MKWFNLDDYVNLLSIIGAIVIIICTLIVVGRLFKLMKVVKKDGELSEHNWDGIGEYLNPLPKGWSIAYLVLLVWTIWYFLIGYPLNSYSQIGAYNDEVRAHNAKFESKFSNASLEEKIIMGEQIFLVQCSSCHGITADGIDGKAANLTLWGSEKGIFDAVMNGSKGLNYDLGEMPGGLLTQESAKAVSAYVAKELSGIKVTKYPQLVEMGREEFVTCSACHGEDGKGMDGAAPDLTKYGTSSFVVDVLNRGKEGFIGHMPSFSDGRLNDIQKEAVGEYINSLSR